MYMRVVKLSSGKVSVAAFAAFQNAEILKIGDHFVAQIR